MLFLFQKGVCYIVTFKWCICRSIASSAIQCQAVPCHSVSPCPVPSGTLPSSAIRCPTFQCHPVPHHLISSGTLPSIAMWCSTILCHLVPCHPVPHHPMPSGTLKLALLRDPCSMIAEDQRRFLDLLPFPQFIFSVSLALEAI